MRGFDYLSGRNVPLSQVFHQHPRAKTTNELADMEPPTGIPCKKPAAKLPTPSPTKSRDTSGDDVVVWLSDDGLAWNQIAYYLDGSRHQERSQRSATRSLPLDSTSTRQLTSSGTPPTEKTEDFSHRQHSATHEAYPWSPAPTTTRSSSSEVGTYRQSAAHDRQHGWLTEGCLRGLLVRRVAFTSVEHRSLHRFGIDDPLMAD